MTVAMRRAHFGADHAVRRVTDLGHMRRLDRLGKAWPAAARFIFVGGGEQRLARDDIDIDTGSLVAEQLARAGAFGTALLRDTILLRRQLGDGGFVLEIVGHVRAPSMGSSQYRMLRARGG